MAYGQAWLYMILVSVTVAVAAIPRRESLFASPSPCGLALIWIELETIDPQNCSLVILVLDIESGTFFLKFFAFGALCASSVENRKCHNL